MGRKKYGAPLQKHSAQEFFIIIMLKFIADFLWEKKLKVDNMAIIVGKYESS